MRRRALDALLALAAAVVLAVLAAGALGYDRYAVTGGSMGDALPAGSLVLARAVPPGAVAPGDVVTFVPPGHAARVTHRVIATGPDGIRTRGDRNAAADPWRLTAATEVRRVALAVPQAGRAALAARDHAPLLASGALAVLALALLRPPARRRPALEEAS